jgi:hypothetical protein
MGIPTPGVLAGYTNGTITTYNYSLEFGVMAEALGDIAIALTALNLNFEATFGTVGALKPGTMANSAVLSKNYLAQLAGSGDNGNNKEDKKTMYLHGIKSAIDALAKAQHETIAIQTLVASDQIDHNSFQKQATLDALARNDLPAPQPPDVIDTIKEKVKNAEVIHATSMLSGTVASITGNVVDKIEEYILTSGPVVYAQNVIEDGFNYVSAAITNTIKDYLPANPFKIANKLERNAGQAGIVNPTAVKE